MKIHHTALCPVDLDASLRFYREGLGFENVFDLDFEGDWPTLFGARSSRLRSVFLGDPSDPSAGIIELVAFEGGIDDAGESAGSPRAGFFLVSIFCPLDSTLARLAAIGVQPEAAIEVQGVAMAVVRDPDGTRVELIDRPGLA